MDLYTVQETAQMLKVSPVTVRRYIAAGRLMAVYVGRNVRVRGEAIEQFVTPVAPQTGEVETAEEYGKPFSFDNPLWDVAGIIKDGPSDLAENHDKYLAEAYADLHEE
jgi:excisionase family DNA binding protein